MQKGRGRNGTKRPALEPHRVPHAEADAGCLFCAGSLGAGSWHISGGTVSPGIYPGAAGAFSVYCLCVYLPRNDWNIWGRCGFGCFSPYFAPQSKYFGSEGTGSSGGDYSVFWGYANALAERTTVYGGRYMALFPHIFGYADFLSWFIRLSGPQPMLAPVLNVLLTVCSGSFLYHLCLRWFHLPAATLAYLLWTLCPSQTIYNSLVLSEPLYTALILGVLSFLTETERSAALKGGIRFGWGVLSGTAGGVLLRWVNGCVPLRPYC